MPDRSCRAADTPTWNATDYFTYGIHFSAQGYAKMASSWAAALHAHWG